MNPSTIQDRVESAGLIFVQVRAAMLVHIAPPRELFHNNALCGASANHALDGPPYGDGLHVCLRCHRALELRLGVGS